MGTFLVATELVATTVHTYKYKHMVTTERFQGFRHLGAIVCTGIDRFLWSNTVAHRTNLPRAHQASHYACDSHGARLSSTWTRASVQSERQL